MSVDLKSEGIVEPVSAGPYVPPPDTPAAPPSQAPVPVQMPQVVPPPVVPPVQAPQTPPVPVTPPKATPPAVPASQQPTAPSGPTDTLLGELPATPPAVPTKPTIQDLKVPEGFKYPEEFLTKIVTKAPSVAEAQARFDTAHELLNGITSGASVKNKEWIEQLKIDPEVGGKNFDASVKLFRRGVVEEFGADFAKGLSMGKLDAQPEFFKAVVRRMRAKAPSPVVLGDQIPKAPEAPKSFDDTAKNMYPKMRSSDKPKDAGY
jgi:hypothetical protein